MRIFPVLLLCVFLYNDSGAQERRKMLFDLDLGFGLINEKLPEGVTYKPILLAPKYSISLARKEKPDRFFFYAEPQFVIAFLSSKQPVEFEAGLNVGFAFQHAFSKYRIFLGIGSGPHYISVETDLQANGFIFSDNFLAGFSRELKKGIMLNLEFRFRHISNAGLQSPNLGIDTFFGLVGVSKAFGKTNTAK